MRFISQCDLFSLPLQRESEDRPAVMRNPVLPEGHFSHPFYGELHWTPDRFSRMILNHRQGVTGYAPMLNFDHATHNPYAAEAPAAGWIQALEHTPGEGLFALVELTDLGEEAIRKKRYRYASAEVVGRYADSSGRQVEDVISGLALTNTPFHDSLPGLFGQPQQSLCFSAVGPHTFWAARPAALPAKESKSMTLLDRVRKLFGLPDSATEAEAVAALEAQAPPPGAEPPEPTTAPPASETTVLQSPPGELVTLNRAELADLRRRAAWADHAEAARQQSEQQLARERAIASVEIYIGRGVILPAQREEALQFALESPERFQKLFGAAQPQIDTASYGRHGGAGEPASGGAGESYLALVNQRFHAAGAGADWVAIASQVAAEKPELYSAHLGRRVK